MALPAKVGIALPTNPFPLGSAVVAAAGTAVKLVGNFSDLDKRHAHYLEIRSYDANTGLIYILAEPVGSVPPWNLPGGGAPVTGADRTTFLNVVKILTASETWDVPSWMLNQLLLGQFWVDADVNGEFVISAFGEA